MYGGAIPRALLFSVLSTALVALLYYVPGTSYWGKVWRHPFVYSQLAFMISFVLVFRSNFSYGVCIF